MKLILACERFCSHYLELYGHDNAVHVFTRAKQFIHDWLGIWEGSH